MKPAAAVLPIVLLALVAWTPRSGAGPIPVQFEEGVTRAFPVLRSLTGDKLAQGELVQIARADVVESRLFFRFLDGSCYEETVTFSQRGAFTLLSYHLSQRGPSFPETIDARIDRETQRYEVHYKADADSADEVVKGRMDLPVDVYNGMLTTVLKNLAPGTSQVVEIVAFTPRPRLVKMLLKPAADDTVLVGDFPVAATRFILRPQLGVFASLLVTDIPDVKCWIASGDAPGFLKCEGPLYFMGPIWRIEPN